MRKEIKREKKLLELIESMELELIEKTSNSVLEKKLKLPITSRTQIKALIWNMMTSPKYRDQLSYNDYSWILEKWFNYISISSKNTPNP